MRTLVRKHRQTTKRISEDFPVRKVVSQFLSSDFSKVKSLVRKEFERKHRKPPKRLLGGSVLLFGISLPARHSSLSVPRSDLCPEAHKYCISSWYTCTRHVLDW